MTSTGASSSSLGRLPDEQRRKLARSLWHSLRREPQIGPEGEWSTWYVRGGRGSGKTRTGAEGLADDIIVTIEAGDSGLEGDWAVIAPTFADARDTCVEGPSGLRGALAGYIDKWNRSMGHLQLVNGATVFCDGADDGADRIQGKNLRAAWCDEIGLWRISPKDRARLDTERLEVKAWDESVMFAVRMDPGHIYVTGTPKRGHVLVKRLLDDPTVHVTHMRMIDNIDNLHPTTIERLIRKYENTALGAQELDGEFLEDVEGALWVRAMIDASRVKTAGRMARIVVAVDPPGGATEAGIVAAGITAGPCVCDHQENLPHAYVITDRSLFPSGPNHWGSEAIQTYHDHKADKVIGETNYGGDMVISTINNIDHTVPVDKVTATRGKIIRAEPIAALYGDPARPETWEQSRVHHVGMFPDLEEEQTTYTPLVAGSWSPNRLDALVWALTALELSEWRPATISSAGRMVRL